VKPGPIIGKVLKETAEAQALGKIKTKPESPGLCEEIIDTV